MRVSAIAVLLAILLGLSHAQTGWIDTVYTAVLTGNQELPSPGYSASYGVAVCVYQRNTLPRTLDCEVAHNVQSATTAGIYLGTPTRTGPQLYAFTGPLRPVFRQAFALATEFSNYTYADQELDFLNGAWYISIQSYLFSNGEIRGQLLHNSRFYARLSTQSIVPPPAGTIAQGLAIASYSPYSPLRLLQFGISHNVQNPNTAQILFGVPPLNAGPLTTFTSAASPITGALDLSAIEASYMLSELTYVQVTSALNPYAEVQGTLLAIDAPPQMSFSSSLSGANEQPVTTSNAVGCALFYYNCDTHTIEYFVVHTVEGATTARIEQVIPGDNNRIVYVLPRAQTPIYGALQLTPEQEFRLFNSTFQLNILSTSFPNGEIIGNINAQQEYYAYLSGTYVTPPRTTSALGCATFNLFANHTLTYQIVTIVPFPRGIEFSIGVAGQNGNVELLVPGTNRTLIGSLQLPGTGRRALAAGGLYVQVRSALYPQGVIRGQIYPLNPCQVENPSDVTPVIAAAQRSSGALVLPLLLLLLCLLW